MIAWDVAQTIERPFYCGEGPAWAGFARGLVSTSLSLESLNLTDAQALDWATRHTVDYFRAEFNAAQGVVIFN